MSTPREVYEREFFGTGAAPKPDETATLPPADQSAARTAYFAEFFGAGALPAADASVSPRAAELTRQIEKPGFQEPPPAEVAHDDAYIEETAAILRNLPSDAERITFLERSAVHSLKYGNEIEGKVYARWANRLRDASKATTDAAPTRSTFVCDVRASTKKVQALKAEIAGMTDDQAASYLDALGTRLNTGNGAERDPLLADWCWTQMDRLKAGKR